MSHYLYEYDNLNKYHIHVSKNFNLYRQDAYEWSIVCIEYNDSYRGDAKSESYCIVAYCFGFYLQDSVILSVIESNHHGFGSAV
jgi:hypothetical protein